MSKYALKIFVIIIIQFGCSLNLFASDNNPVAGIADEVSRDLGSAVKLAGGSGRSAADPIVFTLSDPSLLTRAEYAFLKALGRSRRLLWKTIGVPVALGPGASLVRRRIETKQNLDGRTITDTEEYFFDRTSINDPVMDLSPPIAKNSPELAVGFPYEIAWLHYMGIYYFSSEKRPDLGYSLAYNAIGVKVTIYVYPIGLRVADLETEVKAAIDEIQVIHGDSAIAEHWGIRKTAGHAEFYFVPGYERESLSYISVLSRNDHFVKIRMTLQDRPTVREIAKEFLQSLFELLKANTR